MARLTESALGDLHIGTASLEDAGELASLHTRAARDLTDRYGRGNWSYETSERAAASAIKSSCVVIARLDGLIVGTFRIQARKPWAIDPSYFTDVPRALYLVDMAVAPEWQRKGVGTRLLDEAVSLCGEWPAQAIRLDAYNADAGAGPFYAKCGYREVGRVEYRGTPLIYFERMVT